MARRWSALPVATGSASPRPDRTSWLRGAPGVLSLRHFGLVPLIPWAAWVPNNLARRKTRRLLTNRPCSSLVYEESDSKERLRVSNWIVQRLYNYAVKKTVELRLLTVFQHIVDPTRVRTVADKNSAVTPLDLRPTLADHVFKGNGIEV